jgi:ATP citrate (pro-S)-lyase
MRSLGETLGVNIQVFGPEMHVTGIVPLALFGTYGDFDHSSSSASKNGNILMDQVTAAPNMDRTLSSGSSGSRKTLFSNFSMETQAFIYGMQPKAVQGMLDFDFMCNRDKPSVACMIYPFGGHHVQKFYWGTTETLIPVYTSISEAVERFPNVDVVVNFASFRRCLQINNILVYMKVQRSFSNFHKLKLLE